MKHEELVVELSSVVACEWIGTLEFNNVPYLIRGHQHLGRVPVAIRIGYEDGRSGYTGKVGDILGFLRSSQVGDCLVMPDYRGTRHIGNFVRTLTNYGWSEKKYFEC